MSQKNSTQLIGDERHRHRFFFIPVYNESKSIEIIRRNIKTIKKHCPGARVLISDNCSTDDTFAKLTHLQNENPDTLLIKRQARNVGIANNCLAIEQLPEGSIITFLGGNDYLYPKGLRHLERCIERNREAVLLISNWSFYTNSASPVRSRIYTGDVTAGFSTTSLNDYLQSHPYPPNGIMQYTGRKDVLCQLNKYSDSLTNPLLGAFFEAFPQLVVACAGEPLTLIKHVEETGWRRSKEDIIRIHTLLTLEMYQLLSTGLNEGRLSRSVYRRCLLAYLKVPIDLLSKDWGRWQMPQNERRRFIKRTLAQLFDVTRDTPLLTLSLVVHFLKRRIFRSIDALRIIVGKSTTNHVKAQPAPSLPDHPHTLFFTEIALTITLFSLTFKSFKPAPTELFTSRDLLKKELVPASEPSSNSREPHL